MSDDDNNDDNIINSAPLFEEKYQRNRGAPKDTLRDKKDAIEWCQKCFAKTVVDGKFRIINEEDETNIYLMTKKDFTDAYQHMKILSLSEDNKPKNFPITELWLNYQDPRRYKGIIFDPSKLYDRDDEYYNPWRGFAIISGIGDVERFLDYVLKIVVSNDQEHYEWLMDWCAHIFQKPWEKPGTCVVLRGLEGIGKSFFAETIGQLISGRKNNKKNNYYFKTSNPEHIMNHFNDHIANVILLHLEETFYAGDKKGAHLIKDFVAGDELSIGQKHLSTRMSRNYMRLIMNGNDDWLVLAGKESRRFAVFDVSDELRQNTEFYKDMSIWLDQGGFEALMYYFKHREIKIDVRKVPITEGLLDQRVSSLDSTTSWWLHVLVTGRIPCIELPDINGNIKVVKEVLFDHYCNTMRKTMTRTRSSETEFANKIRSFVPKIVSNKAVKGGMGKAESLVDSKRLGPAGQQRMTFIIPSLRICRECMDFVLGSKYNWEDDGDGGWSRIQDMSDSIYM